MPNMCSYGYVKNTKADNTYDFNIKNQDINNNSFKSTRNSDNMNPILNNDIFSINDDRLEIFGISINIDDLIILIMLFFMFKENQIDYSIIIILALILFDQN